MRILNDRNCPSQVCAGRRYHRGRQPVTRAQAKNWAEGCASLGPLLVTADEYNDSVVVVSREVLYWGTPIVFAEKDLPNGLQNDEVKRLTFSGGIGTLENSLVELAVKDQLRLLK